MTAMGSLSQPKPALRVVGTAMGDGRSDVDGAVRTEECRGCDAGMRRVSETIGEASFGWGWQ